jgi:hypothetical protein
MDMNTETTQTPTPTSATTWQRVAYDLATGAHFGTATADPTPAQGQAAIRWLTTTAGSGVIVAAVLVALVLLFHGR